MNVTMLPIIRPGGKRCHVQPNESHDADVADHKTGGGWCIKSRTLPVYAKEDRRHQCRQKKTDVTRVDERDHTLPA